jgi:hypothetical protein
VNLGSLRLRQDYLIGRVSSAVSPRTAGSAAASSRSPGFSYLAQVTPGADASRCPSLAFASSRRTRSVTPRLPTITSRARMEGARASWTIPRPRPHSRGKLDLSDAYAVGIGEYDKLAVRWLYSDFPPGTNEAEALDAIVQAGLRSECAYGPYRQPDHRRGPSARSVWDNGRTW